MTRRTEEPTCPFETVVDPFIGPFPVNPTVDADPAIVHSAKSDIVTRD